MRHMAIGLTALLAGCGDGVSGTATTNDAGGRNVAAAAANGVPAVRAAAAECGKKPDFAPVYGDALISLCTAGPGAAPNHESGTVIYTTAADPKTVLGWSRAQANASGLGQRISTDTVYSAGEATKRSIMVMVAPEGSGTKVTVNWGRDL